MSIRFQNEKHVKDLKQASYALSNRDKKIMNEILNSLVKEEQVQKVSLNKISSASSLAFVVWRNEKSRVVVNLRRMNTRLYSNAYFLFRQDIILFFFENASIFSFIDLTKRFFQQEIKSENWWKTIFVIEHRRLKWLTVFIMRLEIALEFFQHRVKNVFDDYLWKFVLIYIDDIIVFSSTIEEHLLHLKEMLTFFEKSDVILSLEKCHFAYFSISALKHHVFRLDLSTLKEKIKAIKKLQFLRILRKLERGLSFFEYYRKFVAWYANIEKPLVKLKIMKFKNAPRTDRQRQTWADKTNIESQKKKSIRSRTRSRSLRSQRSTFTKRKTKNKNAFTHRILHSSIECIFVWETLKKEFCKALTLTFN